MAGKLESGEWPGAVYVARVEWRQAGRDRDAPEPSLSFFAVRPRRGWDADAHADSQRHRFANPHPQPDAHRPNADVHVYAGRHHANVHGYDHAYSHGDAGTGSIRPMG